MFLIRSPTWLKNGADNPTKMPVFYPPPRARGWVGRMLILPAQLNVVAEQRHAQRWPWLHPRCAHNTQCLASGSHLYCVRAQQTPSQPASWAELPGVSSWRGKKEREEGERRTGSRTKQQRTNIKLKKKGIDLGVTQRYRKAENKRYKNAELQGTRRQYLYQLAPELTGFKGLSFN